MNTCFLLTIDLKMIQMSATFISEVMKRRL